MSQPADLVARDEVAEARAIALGLFEIFHTGARRAEDEPEPEADPTDMLVDDCESETGGWRRSQSEL